MAQLLDGARDPGAYPESSVVRPVDPLRKRRLYPVIALIDVGPTLSDRAARWLRYVPTPPGECAPLCSAKRKPIIGTDLRIETERRIGDDRGSPEGSIPANLLPMKDLAHISPLPVRIGRDEYAV